MQIAYRSFIFSLFLGFSCLMAQNGSDLQLAEAFRKNGETEKALLIYKDLFAKDPNTYTYRSYLDLLLETKALNEAEKVVKRQLKKAINPFLVRVDLGKIYILQGENQKGEKEFKSIIEDWSSQSGSVAELAQYFIDQTRTYSWAIDLYLKDRSSLSYPSVHAYELANLYRLSGNISAMTEEFLSFLEEQGEAMSEFVKASLQSVLAQEDKKKNIELIKRVVGQRVQKQGEVRVFQDLLIWVLLQETNFKAAFTQAKSFMLRFQDGGQKVFLVGKTALDKQDFVEAETIFRYLSDLGSKEVNPMYIQAKMALLSVFYQRLIKGDDREVERLKKDYELLYAEFPLNESSLELTRNLAQIYAFHTKEVSKAIDLLYTAIESSALNSVSKAECKLDLADVLLYNEKVWDARLLYGQVEKDFKQDGIGFEAKLKNAQLAYYMGDFSWAMVQADVLKAATSKLIANDALELSLLIKENNNEDSSFFGLAFVARADAASYRKQWSTALILLDSVLLFPAEYRLFDDVYYKKAQAYYQMDSLRQALTCYEKVYTDFSEGLCADDALWEAALLCEKTNDFEKAFSLLELLFTNYSDSTLSNRAKEKYRELRTKYKTTG